MLNMKIIFKKKSFYVLFVGYLLEPCIGKSGDFYEKFNQIMAIEKSRKQLDSSHFKFFKNIFLTIYNQQKN